MNIPKAKYDYLIVGAGLYGATFAHIATCKGKKCLIVDKRNHTGGNIYCENIEGINVHKYGAHIFHTSDKEVWDFANGITPFNNFINSPVAIAPDNKLYNLPFNMNTFHQMWGVTTPSEAMAEIERQRTEIKQRFAIENITEPRNLEEQALLLAGSDIYHNLIKGYTEKQWGRKCSELPAFIIKRLPFRFTYNNNYFNDSFQGIPALGYNKLIDGLLEGSDIMLETDFFEHREELSSLACKILYTGPIDRYFDFCFGPLDYRTVRFETKIIDTPNHQGNAVVNYTSAEVPYTRVIEHKHFELSAAEVYDNPRTVVSWEYSSEWKEGAEPYYPVNDSKNQDTYKRYKALADKEQNVMFGGRLAEFKYYDMAPIIREVLDKTPNI